MDIIEQIEIPSFERKNANFRRNFAIAAGCVGLIYALEHYNGSVSRTWKSVHRGVTAAIAAWLEDHGGFPLFSLEGDDVHLSHNDLDLNGLCGPRFTHDGSAATTAAAAAYLTQGHKPQNPQQQQQAADGVLGGADPNDETPPGIAAAHLFASADTPSFFQSTKFFACLDVEEARELFRATRRVSLPPHEVLFRSGDPSDSGIYIVLHGTLGVFLEDPTHNTPPIHANTLRSGESVGDLDVVDGAVRTVSCMALESGCLLVNVPRELFMEFVHSHPRALMLYLQQGLARLWRVAHFVLADFLQLQLYRPKPPGSALAAETAAAATVAASAAGHPPPRTLSNLFGHEQGTQTDPLPPPSPPSSSSVSVASPPMSSQVVAVGPQAREVAEAPLQAVETDVAADLPAAQTPLADAPTAVEASTATMAATQAAVEAEELDEEVDTDLVSPNGGGGGSSKKSRRRRKAKQAAAAATAAMDAAAAAPVAAPAEAVPAVQEPPGNQQPRQEDQPPSGARAVAEPAQAAATLAAPPLDSATVRQNATSPASYSVYVSPCATPISSVTGLAPAAPSPSAPTFNELLASAAASARPRGAGGPTHGPLRPEAPPTPSTMAAAAAAAALLANIPPPPPSTHVPSVTAGAAAGSAPGAASQSVSVARSGPPASAMSATASGLPLQQGLAGIGGCGIGDATAALAGVRASADCSLGGLSGSVSASTIGSSTATISSAALVVTSAPPLPSYSSAPSGSSGAAAPRGGARAGGLPGHRYGNGGLFGFPGSSCPDDGPRMQGPACRRLPNRSASLRWSFVLGERACLATGWDVIDMEELSFEGDMWPKLSDPRSGVGSQLPLAAGGLLQDVDWASGCFYLLLDGHLLAERPAGPPGGPEDAPGAAAGIGGPGPGGLRAGSAAVQESALIAPGSLISCAAFLSSTASRCKVVALEPARLVAFSWQTLEALVVDSPTLLIRLLVAASAALGPVVRRFISLGLNRVWLESGDVAYRQGDFAECLYVVISGRLRLLHETAHPITHVRQLHLEEEVGRGEAVGAVWAITGGHHDTTALCVRDSEVVRMSRSAFRVISADSPLALSKLFSNIARRLVAAWDSRVRSDRGASSSNAAATSSAADACGGGRRGGAGVPPLPNPARLGLTPLKSAGQLAASSGVVRGPRPSGRRGEIVTIAILPAGVLPDAAAAATMASALSGSPTDVAAAAAALAAGEAASMGDSMGGSSGTGRAGSYSGLLGGAGGGPGQSGSWRWPPGLSKQAAALATLTAIKRLSGRLKDALSPFGPVLLLDATVLSLQFPTASERLDVLFYRSKVTSWMAAQEEEYRFILLEADVAASPWSSVCVAQADCILLVAPEGSAPQLSQPEDLLVFNSASPAFARPKPRRSGLTPGLSAAPSSAHLPAAVTVTTTMTTNGSAAAATAPTIRSPSRLLSSSGSGREPTPAPAPSPAPSPPSRSSTASLNAGVAPVPPAAPAAPAPSSAAAATAVGGVGGSQHPHHLYGAAQNLYGASSAAMLRRVELVLLHPDDGRTPSSTADWLAARPNLSRHHHIRLDRQPDIQRLARWMAGKTVGIVLSGGGSRGLAHLGVLTALEDAGVPLDAVGGTSQGAFMAALYAQGLGREALNHGVRHYAQQLGSVRHLLSDITLPVLSLFSGSAFDQAVRRVFERGAQRLEDLWLPFFCVTTNLTRGEASVHTEGTLWKLVRASMTIVGLLPPVWEDGCLLVDGGYMNNMPVDVMRGMMGVDSVIVVDVEGRDDLGWRSLTPYDGGLSGWRLLWDRLCPFPRWRFTAASHSPGRGAPRYAALINKLTSMTHVANLKRVAVEHRIDLYLRPPGLGGFRLMDFHLMDRIVKDAYRYATSAITQWKLTHRVGPFGIEDTAPPLQPVASTPLAAPGPVEVGPGASAAVSGGSGGGGVVAAAVVPNPVVGLSPVSSARAPSSAGTGAGVASTPGSGGAGGVPGGGAAAAVPSCMTQLQKKQQPAAAVLAAVTASVGGTVPTGGVPFAAPPSQQQHPPAAAAAVVARRPTPPRGAVPPALPPAPRPMPAFNCPPPTSSPASSAPMSPAASRISAAAPVTAIATATARPSAPLPRSSMDNDVKQNPAAGGGTAPAGVRFADKVFVSPVESSAAAAAAAHDGDDDDDEQLLARRWHRRSGSAASGGGGGGDGSCGGAGDGVDGSGAGSPPSPAPAPTLRPVMSRMSRSATRHSLLELQ